MQTLHELYIENPFWFWLAVGATFVGFDIAVGSGKLIWGGVAAAVLAFINLAGVRLGAMVEWGMFAVVAAGGVLIATTPWRPKPSANISQEINRPSLAQGVSVRSKAEIEPQFPSADERRTARLIGRIGRTTSSFANGVGRVWIDGAEWGAELDGEDTLPTDTPVRIMGVTGGVRLHVRNLMIS